MHEQAYKKVLSIQFFPLIKDYECYRDTVGVCSGSHAKKSTTRSTSNIIPRESIGAM